jgi:hypothetical protein
MDARAPIAVVWAMRIVVLTLGEEDPNVLAGVRALGADTVVTMARPSPVAANLAQAAGLRYIPFVSTQDIDRLLSDSEFRAAIRAIPGIAGFHYMNDQIVEGYTTAHEQERAYTILKSLFPAAIVIHPTRLDLLATDPTFADLYIRPEFTDYVAPYFYPVGTTILGTQGEGDPWEERLALLLGLLQPRIPSGKPVLPVLQAFEQDGYPVGADLPSRQLDVYRKFWPDISTLAAFWWGDGTAPLRGLGERPALRSGVRRLFAGLLPLPVLRALAERPRAVVR